jgi:choline dehydrogenase-like flavoprotein
VPGAPTEQVDVLIVGAGPSGAVAAHTMASRGFSVVCLEQGDWVSLNSYPGDKPEFELLIKKRWAHDPNVRGSAADYPLEVSDSDLSPVMFSAVGGSSIFYGAEWVRLLPSDFRVRTLDGLADDWPISYQDVWPYYDRVEAFIGVSGLGGDPAYPEMQEPPLPPAPLGPMGRRAAQGANDLGWHWWPGTNAIPTQDFKHMSRCVRWGVCEWGCPEGAKASFDLAYWPHAVQLGARLVTGARVREVTVDSAGLANGATWVDREGGEHHQPARFVILASNGIGTPRLLLNSRSASHPDGLANSSGLVGRNLMLHPNCTVTGLYEDCLDSWLGPAGHLLYSLQFYETDENKGFPRGSKLHVLSYPGVLSVLDLYGDRPYGERWGRALHELAPGAGHALLWAANTEDLPDPDNRITLDPELTDADGVPAPKVHYRISDDTWRNLRFTVDRMREAHEASGAETTFGVELWRDQPGHLLGTARMGDDPATSVVDRWGRSHDVPNLAIVDGSVFVTSGAMNPTATIAALALRAADHLADEASNQKLPT